MLGITGVCSRLIGELVQALGVWRLNSTDHQNSTCKQPQAAPTTSIDELMLKAALTAVFGMENNGKINKEKARRVVENLGLMYSEEEKSWFDLPGGVDDEGEEQVVVEEVLVEMQEKSRRDELLREAFKIFDVDGNGYIDATELKRVLQCLGLDKGWDMPEIQKMLKVVDLNLDGKVDFGEFELMMG
ncbi:hypothetical protein LWI28_012955 [Acer negundo]|uniref:EF-hand domain-containing protein n=1 Tax=Acer negundo TaxID=4023 RepID=A0AAD5J9D9_ACENE|nr:hypothetical protein LWI28_012955 [Acer negundo]KAK4854590.1 hypothetical protein QYF36_026344 [Acer negundo]